MMDMETEGQSTPAIEAPEYGQQDNVRAILEKVNIAEDLDEQQLIRISKMCLNGYENDKSSRSEWERAVKEWTKLATQYKTPKSFPWSGAANVKYPLISTAAMQFSARAYPSLVPQNGQIVNATVVGKDPDGSKLEQASRVSTYMSYQIMNEIPGWEDEMDKLLVSLPVIGMAFKKTYWDSACKQMCSELVLAEDLVVNYWTKCLEDAERVTQVILMSPRKVKEKIKLGIYLDIDLPDPPTPDIDEKTDLTTPPSNDETTPFTILEQHTWLHLKDDDDECLPYIVTLDRDSGEVLRITARFDESTIYQDEDTGEDHIKAINYYTKFGFIPNPDGSFYDLGFGTLLGPINEAVNTVINQLLDSGTINNLQSGFLGKGLRLRQGETAFTPGEWKQVNATGTELKNQILPLPTKEPSSVLFQLMGALITSGKELASVAEIFTGKMPGQNTPATTTMATVEQGMKVFTSIYKRIYRALQEEFKKLYRLNGVYMNPKTYTAVLDEPVGPEDFQMQDGVYNIIPGADPSAASQQEKVQKAQALMQLIPSGVLNPVEVVKRLLEAMEIPSIDTLMNQQVAQTGQMPPPPPDPKVQAMEAKAQADQQLAQTKIAQMTQEGELKARSEQVQLAMKQQQHAQDMQFQRDKAQQELQVTRARDEVRVAGDRMKMQQSMLQSEANHAQQMRQNDANNAQKAQQQKTQAAQKKQTPKKGSK